MYLLVLQVNKESIINKQICAKVPLLLYFSDLSIPLVTVMSVVSLLTEQLWNKCIDLRLFLKCKEGLFSRSLRLNDD